MKNLEKYLEQDIFNSIYLFHGSPFFIEQLEPKQSTDSINEENNDKAVFLTSWFINATAYSFRNKLKEVNDRWSFSMNNNGEKIDMKEYDKKSEKLLLELAKQDEQKNKKLMTSMWTILITSTIFYIGILLLAVNTLKEGVILGTIICVSTIVFLIAGFIGLKLEVDAGYYECKKCHYKFVPSYKEVIFATHLATTRHLKCPKCHKRSWKKKLCLNNKL